MTSAKRLGYALPALLLLLGKSGSASSQSGPSAWVGDPAVVESVSQIMSRDALVAPSPGQRALHGQRLKAAPPKSTPAVGSPQAPPASPQMAGPLSPQTLGTNFLGVQSPESVFIPPDSMGSVGPSQIIVCVNGRIKVFDKAGNLDMTVLNVTTDAFFNSVRNGTSASDCRVRYDRASQRWFVVMINTPSSNNRVMLAVSQGPTITTGSLFSFFQFQQNLVSPAGDTNLFADYPTLGIDANALYIGTNMFGAGARGTYRGSTGFVVQKTSVLGAGPIVATALRGIASSSGAGAYTPQGVDNDDPAATKGLFVGVDISSASSTTLTAIRVLNPGSASPAPSIDATLPITVPPFGPALGGIPAQGSTTAVDDVDYRLMMAQMKNGNLWTVHSIQVDMSGTASATGGRDGARWYEVGGLFTASPSLTQSGTVFDASASNPSSYFVPSIAASGQGHVAFGSTVAGPNEHCEIAVTGRLSGDALGTLRTPPTLAQTSTTAYNVDPSDPVQRWGDYSFTCVDPVDNMTFWTFQEYCNATNSWAVRVIELKAPPPATPSAVSPNTIAQNQPSVDVTLTGTSVSGSGFYDPGTGFTGRLQVSISGGVTVNSLSYVNPTTITMNLSTVGASVGSSNVTVTNPDGQMQTGTGLIAVTLGPPNCTVTPSGTSTNQSPIVFTMTFSEAVTGFSTAGIQVTGGTAGAFTSVNASTYTLAVTPSGQGPVTCFVSAGAAQAVSDGQNNLASNSATVTYDTLPPAPPVITSPASGTLTNNNKPTLMGTAEGSSTVTVSDGATVLGSTSASAGGNWTFSPGSPLADGPHSLTATATDAAGNVSPPSAAVGLTVDTVSPTCSVNPPATPTRLSPVTFTITFNKTVVGLTAAGITVTHGTKGALGGTGASYTLPVTPSADGTVTCQVPAGAAQDLAGNPSVASNVASVLFDSTPPTAPGTPVGTPNPNSNGNFTLSWTAASDGTGSGVASYTVWRSANGAAFTILLSGVAGTTLAQNGLSQGGYRYQVQAVDAAGNVGPLSPASQAVVVDTTVPHTTILLAPPNPSSSSGATFTFSSSQANCSFQTKLDGAAAWSGNGTATVITFSGLANGSHTFQVRAVDLAGNVDPTPPSYTWTVNTAGGVKQPPSTVITSQPTNPTAQTTATFTFISSEPGGTFDIQLDGGGWVSNGASGTKTYSGLAKGSHTFLVRAVDTALNVDPAPPSYTWTIVLAPLDATAPLLNPFGDDVSVTNWAFSSTDALVTWAVDATPASMPGNPYYSAPYSLNYNNGTNYDTPGVANSGNATSPAIAIAGLSGVRLKFFCNYQTETPGTDHDFRSVQISNNGFTSLLVNELLSTSPGSVLAGSCSAMGTWHEHVIPLAGMAGPIQVRFRFDTGDAALNQFDGWFVDDFEVSDLFVSGLNQYVQGSATPLPVGGVSPSGSVTMGGVLSRDASGNVTLQVEVQPVGTPFSGVPTATQTASGPGTPIAVLLSLANGSYHWQARTVSGGVTSSWMSFGLNAETDPDFSVQFQSALAASGGGGGGGHKCGGTGCEGILFLGLLYVGRRRLRRIS